MKLPLFGAGVQGKSPIVTAQRRLNMYADIQPLNDATSVAFYGTPGLTEFYDFGASPIRGMEEVGDLLYVVYENNLYEVNNAAVATSRGTLNTASGIVDMRWNGTQLGIVDGTNGYSYTPSTTTFAQISDGDFLNGANTCAWHDGYFIVAKDNEFAVSSLDDLTAWDATERADAEAEPDSIVRVFETKGFIVLFGTKTTEFWYNSGALDFPYQRLGGGVVDYGLASRWSVSNIDNKVFSLLQNPAGQVQVGFIQGGQVAIVSTPDVEAAMGDYSVLSDATALSYRHSGHSFYQINFNADAKSWLYDLTSGVWSELQTGGTRHLADKGTLFQNKIIVSSYTDGRLYRLDTTVYTDNGTTIKSQLRSRHIFSEDGGYFPVGPLWLDMETGVGLTGESSPQVMLRVSKDKGRSWGNELWREFGETGEYTQRVRWTRLGRARDAVFEVTVTDPVKRVILNEGWLGE